MWWAVWYERVDDEKRKKKVRVSTGVHVEKTALDGENVTEKELRELAQETADNMEAQAVGSLSSREAVHALELSIKRRGGGRVRKKLPTVREMAERYVLEHGPHVSDPAALAQRLRKFVELCGDAANRSIAAFSLADGQDYVMARLEEVKGTTVERDVADVSAMFNRAVAEQLISRNPMVGVKIPAWARAEAGHHDSFSPEQLGKILTCGDEDWEDCVLVTLLLGGQRLGDMACLRWDAWDEARGFVRVRTGKVNRPMAVMALPLLTEVLTRRRTHAVAGLPYVFPRLAARYGQAGGKSSKLSLDFRALLRRVGVIAQEEIVAEEKDTPVDRHRKRKGSRRSTSPLSFHSLRETAVTFLAGIGCPWELVMLIVGISSADIARRHYLRPSAEQLREQMRPMEELLTRLRSRK